VIGRFSALVSGGLANVLCMDPMVDLLATDVADTELEGALTGREPHVAILDEQSVSDLSLPVRLCSALPQVALVVLARRPTRPYCERLLALGARACLPKDASAAEIVSTVRLASAGWHLLPPAIACRELSEDPVTSLTERESEVLELVRIGQSYKQIGLALHIDAETVRSHVRRICSKLGVSSRHELVRRAC
jgi:DNA-binding NarL/FixJ family response regulator